MIHAPHTTQYPAYKDSGVEWMGEIPDGWEVKKIKHVFENLNHRRIPLSAEVRADMIQKDYEYYGASGVIDKVENYLFDELLILVGEDGANLLSRSSRLAFIAHGKYWVNNHAHILKPKSGDIRYFAELLETIDYTTLVTGSAQPKLTQENIVNITICVPPLSEQNAIARYLDEKTAQVDQLIQQSEKIIALLREQRAATINHAVTKGLTHLPPEQGGTLGVPLYPSGVEWIGDVPEGWMVVKLGHYSTIVRGASPRPAGDSLLFDGDFTPWITVKAITNATGKYVTNTDEMLTELGMKQSKLVYAETLVLSNSGATLGVPKILKIDGCINDGSVAFISLSQKLFRDYLYYIFEALTLMLREMQSGYGQPNLNTEIVSNLRVPLPHINTQEKIAQYLDEKTAEIDALARQEEGRIELLREYRAALISEVVTGKVRVPETA